MIDLVSVLIRVDIGGWGGNQLRGFRSLWRKYLRYLEMVTSKMNGKLEREKRKRKKKFTLTNDK